MSYGSSENGRKQWSKCSKKDFQAMFNHVTIQKGHPWCLGKNSVCPVTARDIGDGFCDDEANNQSCNFDGGDCCLNTEASKEYCSKCVCKEVITSTFACACDIRGTVG